MAHRAFDLRRLPFGLRRYRKGEFDARHAAGSGMISASGVPALFGQSRFASRFSYLAHVIGRAPHEVDGPLLERGRRFEGVALSLLAEAEGWEAVHLAGTTQAYAPHPTIPGFYASPDALAFDDQTGEILIGEVKIVGEHVFERDWLGRGLPIDITLQHQAQFACTGAQRGFIGLLVLGSYRAEPIIYPTAPHPRTIALICAEVEKALEMVRQGVLPSADPSAHTMQALVRAYPEVDPARVVSWQSGGPEMTEAERMFEGWVAAKRARRIAEKAEAEARAFFLAAGPDAALFRIGNAYEIKASRVAMPAHTVAASVQARFNLIDLTTGEEPTVEGIPPAPAPLDPRLADVPRADPKPKFTRADVERAPPAF